MPTLTGDQRQLCFDATEWFRSWYITSKYYTLDKVLPSAVTREVDFANLFALLNSLKELCFLPGPPVAWDERPEVEVPTDLLSC
ncbi:MAG TPA: hypothetical protein VJW17_04510, partial [Pyrinomonadaceae bacterium]|nr:hypothetical protein [Pyrinomonadaceae bacterium]